MTHETQKLAFKLSFKLYWNWLEECEDEGLKEMAKLVELKKDLELDKYDKAMAQWKAELVEWGELKSGRMRL